MKNIKFAIVTVLALFALTANAGQKTPKDLVGTKPVYKFNLTNGKFVTNTNTKGKVVLLDFWATWCAPCKAASPTMQKLHQNYAKNGLVVVGVNAMESKKGPEPATNYAKEHGYTFNMAYNADNVAKDWNVTAIPLFVMLDKTGKVRFVWTGFDANIGNKISSAAKQLINEK